MKGLKSILSVIRIIVKYGAIVSALLKAINVFSEELEKIKLPNEPETIEENE